MLRGLYTAYTGMVAEQNRLDCISNNLANAATVGYKTESIVNQSFEDMLTVKIRDGSEAYQNRAIGSMSLGTKTGEVYTSYDQGSLRETGNTYDMAISGDGFFAVRMTNRNGEDTIRYTRNGNFKMTTDGYIVDVEGNHLQSDSGDLVVPTNVSEIRIDQMGNVFADGIAIDHISLVDFDDYDYLAKFNDCYYTALDGATKTDATGQLLQGYTEQSNVSVVNEMVKMITVTRAYEAGQKMIQTEDQIMQQAVNSVGRVG